MFLWQSTYDTDRRISANQSLPLSSSCTTVFVSSGFHLAGALLAASMAWLVLAPGGWECAREKLELMTVKARIH